MSSVHRFETVPSTQEVALALARSGSPPGTTVRADRQERGRGRGSHTWASPEGGLYLSTILSEPGDGLTLFPVAACAQLGASIWGRFGVPSVVKWPNDLLVPREGGPPRKLAGTIVDRVESSGHSALLVAGIGVNVRPARDAFPPEIAEQLAILSELVDEPPELDEVETLVRDALAVTARSLGSADGVTEVRARCRAALYGRGRPALVDGTPGGTIRDLADDGALLLDNGAGPYAVYAGDLRVVEP